MVDVAIFGKGDIIEKLNWCKKFSGAGDEDERMAKARLEILPQKNIMGEYSDPSLDSGKFTAKLKACNLSLPNSENLDLFSTKIVRDLGFYVLFEQIEEIPGRPDFDYGIGFRLETYNIFFEEKIQTTVENVSFKTKMGFMKEKVVTKEQKMKPINELFGEDFATAGYNMSIASKDRDNKGRARLALRFLSNLNVAGKDRFIPEKLNLRWRDEASFFAELVKTTKGAANIINKTFTLVGYETAPEFTVLVGDITPELKVKEFGVEEINGTKIIDAKYE